MFRDLRIIGTPDVWSAFTAPNSSTYQPYRSTLITYETVGNGIMLFSVLIAVLFFSRRKIFRRLIIAYLLANMVFLWGDHLLAGLVTAIPVEVQSKGLSNSIMATITTMIWLPYFLVSGRVRRTFVK